MGAHLLVIKSVSPLRHSSVRIPCQGVCLSQWAGILSCPLTYDIPTADMPWDQLTVDSPSLRPSFWVILGCVKTPALIIIPYWALPPLSSAMA